MTLKGEALASSIVTCILSYISLFGSICIIFSYVIARTRSTPKTSYLILHLATSDLIWFFSSGLLSLFWLANNGVVPDVVCYITSPTIALTRMASLIWSVVISFNVLMSVTKRKWFWKSHESDWEFYRRIYFLVIILLALPGVVLSLIKQHSTKDSANLGCSPKYEPLGLWYEIFFTELLPILLGFLCNLYAFFSVRKKMSKSAFPQSVRKRRKRVMYHYIIVCIVCWLPTVVLYLLEMSGIHIAELDIIARAALYASGFMNFLVFGLQDPHLKKSFHLIILKLGFTCVLDDWAYYVSRTKGEHFSASESLLKTYDVEKVVMFQEDTIIHSADIPKDRKSIYRNKKLSNDDKKIVYQQRPDLNPLYNLENANDIEDDRLQINYNEIENESDQNFPRRSKAISTDIEAPSCQIENQEEDYQSDSSDDDIDEEDIALLS